MAIVKVMTVQEAHDALSGRISMTSLYRAIALGRLKAIRAGKRFIISEDALNDFLTGKK